MEKEKNNKNCIITLLLAIIIILATSIILLSTGTISFKNNANNDDGKENTITTETTGANYITKLINTYSYKGKYVDNKQEIPEDTPAKEMIYDKLTLNSDGTAEAEAGVVHGGGYSAKGKWYISEDEIIILNEECKATIIENKIEYPNCNPTWTYKYKVENNNIVITSSNNTMENITLNKD